MYWKSTMLSAWSILFWTRLKKPSSLFLSLYERCSCFLITFMILICTCFSSSMYFSCLGPRLGCSTADETSWARSKEEQSPLPPCWPSVFRCSQEYSWLSGLQAYTAGSCPDFHLPGSPCCSPQACSQFFLWACATGLGLTQVQHLALGIVEPHYVFVSLLLKLVQASLNSIPSFYCISCTTKQTLTATLLRVQSVSWSLVLIKSLKSTGPKTEPWDTPFIINLQPDTKPLATTLCPPFKSSSLNLEIRMWCQIMPKVLQNSWYMTSVALFFCLPIQSSASLQKATRLVRHDLPWVKQWRLSWITSLFCIRLNVSSRWICFIIFQGTDMRLTGM